MDPPVISLVVLAWNQLPLTTRCVDSLRRGTDVPYELVVVDNGSEPEAAVFARAVADIAVLNETNLGFAAGMNRGLAVCRGEYVAFINNDTEFPAGWASLLLDTFAAHPGAGLVLPAVTAAGNPFAVRETPGTAQVVVPRFRVLPSGVVYVMPRSTAVALGGWSEEFAVASREDLDLLFKVWVNDLNVVLDERVLVDHESSATVRTQLPDRRQRWEANWDVFVAKWTADNAAVPRLPSCSPEAFAGGLERARIAATWMERWYDARFRTPPAVDTRAIARLERERDDLVRRLDMATSTRSRWLRTSWSAVRRLVPRPLRLALFPRLRGLYTTAFPERAQGEGRIDRSARPEEPGDDSR